MKYLYKLISTKTPGKCKGCIFYESKNNKIQNLCGEYKYMGKTCIDSLYSHDHLHSRYKIFVENKFNLNLNIKIL
jgi:hypothetical protein